MKKKVLVVDNHKVVLKFMASLLEKEGHQVLTAEDGLLALDILKTYVPDIVFIDLVMPKIRGDKLCRIIRKMPKLRNTYIAILSAIAAEEQMDLAEMGADACIAKGPFNEMAEHVLAALDQSDRDRSTRVPGEIIRVHDVYGREITRELLSTKNHLEAILNNMTEGILELTPEGRIVFANPASILLIGISEEMLLGSDFIEFFEGNHRKRVEDLLHDIGDTPRKIIEDSPVLLNGKHISLNILPVRENGQRSFVVILVNVTEVKRSRDTLRNINRELVQAYAKMRDWKDQLSLQQSEEEIGFLINENGQVLGATDKGLKATGKKGGGHLGWNIHDLIDEESRQKLNVSIIDAKARIFSQTSIRMILEQLEHQVFETRLMHMSMKKGSAFLVLMRRPVKEKG